MHGVASKDAYVDGVGALILMKVTVQNDIHTVVVQQSLHGFPHALILQIVGCVCSKVLHCKMSKQTPTE